MYTPQPPSRRRPAAVRNRVSSFALHIPKYQVGMVGRLASDSGVSKTSIWRLIHAEGDPTYAVIAKICKAMSREMGKTLDVLDLAVPPGLSHPTLCVCSHFNCTCLPDWAYTPDGELRWQFWDQKPGQWTIDRSDPILKQL